MKLRFKFLEVTLREQQQKALGYKVATPVFDGCKQRKKIVELFKNKQGRQTKMEKNNFFMMEETGETILISQ